MTARVVEAVLRAANEWVAAQEALLIASRVDKETEAEQEALDIAGSRLVAAVVQWRSKHKTI